MSTDERRGLELVHISEPRLLFQYGQTAEDPRFGLSFFGPYDAGKSYGLRTAIIGTEVGRSLVRNWLRTVQGSIQENPSHPSRPLFPGFEAAFQVPLSTSPAVEVDVSEEAIREKVLLDDPHQRVHGTVSLFTERIRKETAEGDVKADVWFVVIPEEVWKYCRPQSVVDASIRQRVPDRLSRSMVRHLRWQRSFLYEPLLEAYQYDVNFHNQLKARLLDQMIETQVVRESTLAPEGSLLARQRDVPSRIAWNLSSALFYKGGSRPWKAAGVREGVCYLGLVFKKDEKDPGGFACCAAQMFLDSGDGLVFRGTYGPWFSERTREFHLSRDAAKKLVEEAVSAYSRKAGGPPSELFIHGKVRFEDDEWNGFRDGAPASTNLVGVRIRFANRLKLYATGHYPVLRGSAYMVSDTTAYLWTRGYIPWLRTYPGWGVPNPILVDVCRGKADLETVLRDILVLTKLNYNGCMHSDGEPVTLRFADDVGEILTAGPASTDTVPLAFRYYI